ncbi:hypothetical protein HED60_23750 [Planctomycetales bacterium ZRK34]|nr:hypothetical protein HED60_23750 [Planctomycetales bacterium ZRK34]
MHLRASTILENFGQAFDVYRQRTSGLRALSFSADSTERGTVKASAALVERNSVQNIIRPLFGKQATGPVCIGNHPDFDHIAGTELSELHPIVTLFMDIESSTRLGLWYPADDVAKIKNAFICAAIEFIHSFDGHVHRIQGDAVMAFFGGKNSISENAVVDSLNCASSLWMFVKTTVIPRLRGEGYDEDFGIRIGIDYAPSAHWSAFGYPGVDEVSATAFQVDAASKLQHAAGRNQIMLGQSLMEFVDFPDVITQDKSVMRNGGEQSEKYLLPNHTCPDGNVLNYRQRLLSAEEYLRCTPLAAAAAQAKLTADAHLQPLDVTMSVHADRDNPALYTLSPASLVVEKGRLIRFELGLRIMPHFPYTITYDVENHGCEAEEHGGDSLGNHSTTVKVTCEREHRKIVHWEATAYRGLHYLTITVKGTSVIARRRIGVYVA